jgi:hypothetical protein
MAKKSKKAKQYEIIHFFVALKIIIILYTIYLFSIAMLNVTLKETTGEITSVYQYDKTVYNPHIRGSNKEVRIRYDTMHYKYTINDKQYSGERYSNLLIFPAFHSESYPSAPVYYFPLFPKYSILFKPNLLYTFYNFIPILILGIILLLLAKKYDLKIIEPRKMKRKSFTEDDKIEKENHNIEIIDMENIFIDKVRNGEKSIRLFDVKNSSDEIVIISIFNAEQIPYMIKVRTMLRKTVYHTFFILEKDYNDALFLIEEYIKNKNTDEKKDIVLHVR